MHHDGQNSVKKFTVTIRKDSRSPVAESRLLWGYGVILSCFIIGFVTYGVYYAFGVFFKAILNDLGSTRATVSGAFSVSLLVMGLLGIAMGGLTDKFGARMVLTLCGVLLGLGYILMSQIRATWQLFLFYGVIGAGMGGSFVPLMSTVARWFVERRSTMTGIVAAGIGVGTLVGPQVANRLIFDYGWRVSYVILGIIVSLVIALCAQLLKREPAQIRQLAYGGNDGQQTGLSPGPKALCLKEAIITGQFWLLFVIFFCFGFCLFGIVVHIVPHTSELGISAASSANILATIGGLSIVGKVVLGRATDITGSRKTFVVCFLLMLMALLWVIEVKVLWMLYAFAGVFGFAYGGGVAAESPLVAEFFGLRSHGLILGVLSFVLTIGGATGPLLIGYIFDVTDSYKLAFLLCAAISLAGLLVTAVLKPREIEDRKGLILSGRFFTEF
jgi:MFS family permease